MPGQAVFHHAVFGRETSFPGKEPPGNRAGQGKPAPAQVLARDGVRGDERAARIGPGDAPGHDQGAHPGFACPGGAKHQAVSQGCGKKEEEGCPGAGFSAQSKSICHLVRQSILDPGLLASGKFGNRPADEHTGTPCLTRLSYQKGVGHLGLRRGRNGIIERCVGVWYIWT